jgi:prephenate dehydrogenase
MTRVRLAGSSAGSPTGDSPRVEETMADRPSAADPTRAEAAARLPSRIAFLGFGLIGGSIALALREAGSASELVAWTPDGTGPAEGRRRRLIDQAAPSAAAALDNAGLVILAGPPLAVLGALTDLAGPLNGALAEGVTITDVASTKTRVVESATARGLPFVGGHPMAGRETSGVAAATRDLFVDRPWVVVPSDSADPADVERVEALASATGARPIRMTAAEHDAAVASISHLPLVVAVALVESVVASPAGATSWPLSRRLAATGWSDMTRLARGDPEMGAGILATNGGAVTDRLRSLRQALDAWIEVLDPARSAADASVIRDRLQAAREALEREPAA